MVIFGNYFTGDHKGVFDALTTTPKMQREIFGEGV